MDIYADDEKFYVIQGQELIRIFETVFERYHISEKALFRYAERRKVGTKIYTFVNRETKIQLIQQSEASQ